MVRRAGGAGLTRLMSDHTVISVKNHHLVTVVSDGALSGATGSV